MALLVTADLSPGRIALSELTRSATEAGGGSVDSAIDSCSATAWHQDIWKRLKSRYTKPATCPAGELHEMLVTLTLYWLWARWTANFAQNEGATSPNQLKAARDELLKFFEDVANSVDGASIEGLTEIDVTTAGTSLVARDLEAPFSLDPTLPGYSSTWPVG